MSLIHVHVYKIAGKAEVDVNAYSSKEATELALKMTSDLRFGESDCKHLAMVPNYPSAGELDLFAIKCYNSLVC